MPVLSRGVVARTFGPSAACCLLLLLAACCCCLLLLLKRVAHPWPLKGGVKPRQGKPGSRLQLGPSWVLVLRNAWEITVEERSLALEMCLHGYGDCPETRLENGSFSPQNGPPRGTTAWYTPYWRTHLPSFDSPIAMKDQRPSSETPAWRSGDRPELSGQSSRKQPKTAQKRPFLDTKLAIERARRLETAQNLFVVMRICSPVVLSYLDAGFEPRCGGKDFWTFCCLLLLLAVAC